MAKNVQEEYTKMKAETKPEVFLAIHNAIQMAKEKTRELTYDEKQHVLGYPNSDTIKRYYCPSNHRFFYGYAIFEFLMWEDEVVNYVDHENELQVDISWEKYEHAKDLARIQTFYHIDNEESFTPKRVWEMIKSMQSLLAVVNQTGAEWKARQ